MLYKCKNLEEQCSLLSLTLEIELMSLKFQLLFFFLRLLQLSIGQSRLPLNVRVEFLQLAKTVSHFVPSLSLLQNLFFESVSFRDKTVDLGLQFLNDHPIFPNVLTE